MANSITRLATAGPRGIEVAKLPADVAGFVAPLLDAISQALTYGEVFGPLMVLAVKNDESNLRKCRRALRSFAGGEAGREAATLRELLEAECASGVHKPGAVLHDPSAAIALLWMRRTLQFLVHCFRGVVEAKLPMAQIGGAAYKSHLEPFHGWFLKNTFGMALNGMPSRDEILLRLGDPTCLDRAERDRKLLVEIEGLIEVFTLTTDVMRALSEELDLEDTRKV